MAASSRKSSAASGSSTTRLRSLERRDYFHPSRNDSIEKPSNIFAQIAFLALGISSLLPWNAIIITLPFFLDRLKGTPLHDAFISWLSLLFNAVALFAMGLATWAGEQFTGPSSFYVSILALSSLFLFLAVFPFLTFPPSTFFGIGLTASSLLAAAGGVLQTSTITLAPKYGSGAISSYMSGSALSAVGISILEVFTAYTSTGVTIPGLDSASWSAAICFATSVAISILTLVLYQGLQSNSLAVPDQFENSKDFDVEELPSERTRLLRQRSQQILPRAPQIELSRTESRSRIYSCNFAIFYAGVVTLCLFPAITVTIEPMGEIDPLIFNALHFLVFNVADLAGRSLASTSILFPTNDLFLVTYSALRSLFIPFFLVCNVAGPSAPSFVTSDAVYMLGLFLFGLTHGHCSTLSLVVASEGDDEAQNGRAARWAQFWMMAGIVAGGGASFGVRAIL